MVDVATVNSVMPSAQQAAAATPTDIDAMFSALLQQIADGDQANALQLGADASGSQAQASATSGQPSNTNVMGLVQNPASASFGVTNLLAAIDNSVAVMPAASVTSDDATAPDGTTPQASSPAVKNTPTEDKAGNPTSQNNQILSGLLESTASAIAPTSASSASASSSTTEASTQMPAPTTDEATSTTATSAPSNQPTGNTQAMVDTIAAMLAQQKPQPSTDATGAKSANNPAPTTAETSQSVSTAMPNDPPLDTHTTTADLPPATTQPSVPQRKETTSTAPTRQQTMAAATPNSPPATPPPEAPQGTQNQAALDQASRVTDANNATDDNGKASDRAADTATGAATKAAAEAQAAQITDQAAPQTAMATTLAAPTQPAVAQPSTATAAAATVAGVSTSDSLRAASAAGQVTNQAPQTSSADNKTDLKNKSSPATKAQATSGETAEAGRATGRSSQIGDEARAATPTLAPSETKPVQAEPAHVATASVNHEKPSADTTALQQPTNLLTAVDAGTVTAKVQVTAQHSDGDTVSTLDKLGMTIAARSTEGLHHFDIRLDPAELGRVQVHLTVDDSGQAQATIVADKQQTLDMLQRDSSSLNRALQDAGLNLSNNGLNFSLREQQQQQNEASGQSRRRALAAAAILSTEASQSRSSQGSYAPNSVRLDIRV